MDTNPDYLWPDPDDRFDDRSYDERRSYVTITELCHSSVDYG